MKINSKIFIAGINGLVGSAIARTLRFRGFKNIVGPPRKELDLTDPEAVESFFKKERPEYVFLAGAKVGGIYANDTYPADFIKSNLTIQINVIDSSHKYEVKKLLFLGSSCIYPKYSSQPIKESELLMGLLEPTNEAYAIAKIAGIKMCQAYNKQFGTNFISCMPTNLYGLNDNYHPENSHVLPALIRRIYEAKVNKTVMFDVWGTGAPKREFMYVDDFADACLFLMNNYNDNEIINVGSGFEISIKDLVELISDVVGYKGEIVFVVDMPDGMMRKLIDSSKINKLGWKAKTNLRDGIEKTYMNFLYGNVRK